MLSKLRYFSKQPSRDFSGDENVQSEVTHYVQERLGSCSLTRIAAGTLGICFRVETTESRYFLKTHRLSCESERNLRKEFRILQKLYGDEINLKHDQIASASGNRSLLLMDWLVSTTDPFNPNEIQEILNRCYGTLSSNLHEDAQMLWTIEDIIDEAENALAQLQSLSLVGSRAASLIKPYMNSFKNAALQLPPLLCHGDLSNRNIMLSDSTKYPLVLDWEDAFIGFRGYDYLYWLTFLENRRFLNRSNLGRTELDERAERGALLTIVALKSLISIKSQGLSTLRVPIEQRLLDLLAY